MNSVALNVRKFLYVTLFRLRGIEMAGHYQRFLKASQLPDPSITVNPSLVSLLDYCKENVPYYSRIIKERGDSYKNDPLEYLRTFPILTKDIIRAQFEDLKSKDLSTRKWFYNTSSGSTGEPARFIQDNEYAGLNGAITVLFSKLVGKELGECEVSLWGSERDILRGSEGWKARLINNIANIHLLNTFRMSPERMREYIHVLNEKQPKLILAYAESMYELAGFAEGEGLEVKPQTAIITSAATLFPEMRQKIERVFRCPVYNRYGSREVGVVACERPGYDGLWVAPWGSYIEIVDDAGSRVSDGQEGNILVTSLKNHAMPLIRYQIGDIGILSPHCGDRSDKSQVLRDVVGRSSDTIRGKNGTLVHAAYFRMLMYYKDWVHKFQIVQKSPSWIIFRVVKTGAVCPQADLDEIVAHAKILLEDDCKVDFEFVADIAPNKAGKHRYVISEIES